MVLPRHSKIGDERLLSEEERSLADITTMTGFVESPGGIAPPGAPKTVREPLDSHGSRCSAVSMT